MKKTQAIAKKKLKPLTLHLSPRAMQTLQETANKNSRSRKAHAEMVLEHYCQEKQSEGAKG